MSFAVENYIKTIYNQHQLSAGDSKLGTIAKALNITNAAATDMARKLAAKKLVVYTKYKPLILTEKGKRLALQVLRKHRLWETFLHNTLGLSLHEIHREAEMLEHLSSDFLVQKIENYLGKPAFDPHGDPIPDIYGNLREMEGVVSLSKAEPGQSYVICRVQCSEKEFFDFCKTNGIQIGAKIHLIRQFNDSKMTEINIMGNKMLLNIDLANMIYVK